MGTDLFTGQASRRARPTFAFRVNGEGLRGWDVRRVQLQEVLSARARATIDLVTDDLTASPESLLGASAVLELGREGLPEAGRRFCGVVRRVKEDWGREDRRLCQVVVEPAFACLDEERLTRPFVGRTVPDILREVLGEALGRFEGRELRLRLSRPIGVEDDPRAFAPRALCVQYDETTHAFCCRLMAEEGLTFAFDHSGPVETMIIVDGTQWEPAGGVAPPRELKRIRRRGPGQVLLRGFDPIDPRTPRQAGGRVFPGEDDPGGRALVYDPRAAVSLYAFRYGRHDRSDVEVQAEVARQRLAVVRVAIEGTGDTMALAAGRLYRIERWPGLAIPTWAEGDLLITEVVHEAVVPETTSSSDPDATRGHYHNRFTCLQGSVAFGPPAWPRPVAHEDWAEVLSSFEDDPIDGDGHGRVRVRFLYDRREGVAVAERSPWIPVAQGWAGEGYGLQILPRAGMLVRIQYMFGDPDRPIVAGCLPTAVNRLPAVPPEKKTRLTLKTQSLREGGTDTRHRNEMALDDAGEREEVFVYAGRDFRRKVLHDERTEVDHDERRRVGNAQRLLVLGVRAKTVHAGERALVRGQRRQRIEADDSREVRVLPDEEVGETGGHDRDEVRGDQTVGVKGLQNTTIGGLDRAVLGDGRKTTAHGDDHRHVRGTRTIIADQTFQAAQDRTRLTLADGNSRLVASGKIEALTAAARLGLEPAAERLDLTAKQLRLRCGLSLITVGEDGIVVKAPQILVRGAEGTVMLDPTGALTSGKAVTASAIVLNELRGLPVIISNTPGAPTPPGNQQREMKTEQVETARSAHEREEASLDLEVTLLGDDAPAPHAQYRLLLPDGVILSGQTDGDGVLRERLPTGTRTVTLAYAPEGEPWITRELDLAPDDGSTEAAVALLRHLGYGAPTDADEAVVRAFQLALGLAVTGTMDDETRSALAKRTAGVIT